MGLPAKPRRDLEVAWKLEDWIDPSEIPKLRPAAQASAPLILAFLGASYLGLAYFVGASVGTPSTTRFWVIFTVAAAIFAPIVFLAWRNLGDPNESA